MYNSENIFAKRRRLNKGFPPFAGRSELILTPYIKINFGRRIFFSSAF